MNSTPMLNDKFQGMVKVDKPVELTTGSAFDAKMEMERWERLNRVSLMIMKRVILEASWDTMSNKITMVISFFEDLEKKICQEWKGWNKYILGKPYLDEI